MNHSDYEALDADEVAVCPECDSSQVRFYTPGGYRGYGDYPRYACRGCGERFDEFVTRERYTRSGGRSGLASRLLKAGPDEVSR